MAQGQRASAKAKDLPTEQSDARDAFWSAVTPAGRGKHNFDPIAALRHAAELCDV